MKALISRNFCEKIGEESNNPFLNFLKKKNVFTENLTVYGHFMIIFREMKLSRFAENMQIEMLIDLTENL